MVRIALGVSVLGFALAGPGCDSVDETKQSAALVSVEISVPDEVISLGTIVFDDSDLLVDSLDPPYDRRPTAQSEQLRQLSLRVLAMEAADQARFYTMKMDTMTGEVFAVAHNKVATENFAAAVAPGGRAEPSKLKANVTSTDIETRTAASVSGGVENRNYVGGATYDNFRPHVQFTGRLTDSLGQSSGTLFTSDDVITAAHAVITSSSGGTGSITFAPRQRNSTTFPFGTGSTSVISWETAFTAKNCHVTYSYPSCVFHDLAIVSYPNPTGFGNPGYVGFAWYGDADIIASFSQTTGYPACGSSGIPSCVTAGPYADFSCGSTHPLLSQGSTSNGWPYNDGAHPFFRNGCDFTVGQSGSGLFDQSAGVYLLSLMDFIDCTDTNCVHSADGPRINGNLFNWMLTFR